MAQRETSHAFCLSVSGTQREDGYNVPTVQELLGHEHVETTMIDTHVLNRGGRGVWGPRDGLS